MKICLTCDGVTDAAEVRCAHCGVPLHAEHELALPHRRGDEFGPHPLSGRVFDGKYRLEGAIGRGGMGTVFRAVHEVSHAPAAVKVLNPRYASRADHRDWFVAEARRASRVVHENSARVLDVGITADGVVYLASELCEGETLRELLARRGAVAPAFAVDVLRQIAEGLDAAHRAGVVHRDLTPRNVMVASRDGAPRVKIVDFGIAVGDAGRDAVRSVAAAARGAPAGFANPPYTAPEQLAGEPIDGRADLYALGVIAFELLTGTWPVDGETAAELAEATLAGHVRRLAPRRGVPKSLARLVGELLARRAEERPRDAAEVAERLLAIRGPRSRTLGAVAALLLVASVTALTIAHLTDREPVFLRTRPGGGLVLTTAPEGDAGRRSLQSRDLLATTFQSGGIEPAALRVEVSRDGEMLARLPLGPALDADRDVLRLRPVAAAPLLQRLAELSRDGDVDVALGLPDAAPLGYARLRLDDAPPTLEFTAALGPGGALLGTAAIALGADDDDRIDDLALEVRLLGDDAGVRQLVRVPIDLHGAPRLGTTAGELLGERFPGPRDRGAAELTLVAADRAGNRSRSVPLATERLDLAAPRIERVASSRGDRLVVERPEGATLRLALDASEPGLVVHARGPDAADWIEYADVRVVGDRLELRMPPRRGSERRRASGTWAFRLCDPAGNLGPVLEERLTFRGVDPNAELRLEDGRPSVWLDGALVFDGAAATFETTCNPIYRPVDWRLRAAGGGEIATGAIAGASPGVGRIELGPLAAGAHELEVTLREEFGDGDAASRRWSLRALPEPVQLRLPDTQALRYLPALVAASVLREHDGGYAAGPGWRFTPDEPPLLRGRVWSGGDGVLAAAAFDAAAAGDPIGALAVERGANRIALELVDVLDRPLEVWLGERRAATVDLPGGARGALVANFRHHDQPFGLAQTEARVEYGQRMRLRLVAELPLDDAATRVDLAIAGGRLAPIAVDRDIDGRDQVLFEVPFDRLLIATDLGAIAPGDYARGVARTLRCSVRSPFGEQPLTVPIRTIRSTLAPVRLGDLRADLPAALAAIQMLPVLGPGLGAAFTDPIPADVPERRRIRPAPPIDVRNVPDLYLQDRELTRAAWDAIVTAGLDRAATLGPERRARLVHAFDPLGARRLEREALLPRALGGDTRQWSERLRAAPERPVTGIDAFQAHTAARLAGLLLDVDGEPLRLPFGVELELAALGPDAGERAWNGAAAGGPGLSLTGLRTAASRRAPPTATECAAFGDVVPLLDGPAFHGLDSGVLEWVADLAFLTDERGGEALLGEWLADHVLHGRRVAELAVGAPWSTPDDLVGRLAVYGVVRGVAFDDARAFAAAPRRGDRVAGAFAGVTRVTQVRRDGAGLVAGQIDPRLARIGLRLAGGEAFVRGVRDR